MGETDEPGSSTTEPPRETRKGVGTDSEGGSVVDPTRNVRELVDAAITRQDDLREAENRHIREILDLRGSLFENEQRCSDERETLRANYNKLLREAEAARINAIRSVDVEAVQRAAEVQATQAGVLAAQVTTSADTLRSQAEAAATAARASLATALEPIMKAIEELRQAQYQAQGQKTQVVETQARGGNTLAWVGAGIAGLVLLLMLIGTLVTLVSVSGSS